MSGFFFCNFDENASKLLKRLEQQNEVDLEFQYNFLQHMSHFTCI